jgi:hypothetical protein
VKLRAVGQKPEELTVEVPSPYRVTVTVAPCTRVPGLPVATTRQLVAAQEEYEKSQFAVDW